jgi:hypothetical protein
MAIQKKAKKKASKPDSKPKKRVIRKAKQIKAAKPLTKAVKNRPAPKTAKKQSAKKKKRKISAKKPIRNRTEQPGGVAFVREDRRSRSGEQSGDLQGISRAGSADSESVDELIEEGNAFEAEAVMGVEDADRADGKEVRTHEVLEDDVPSEYLDKD